MCTNLFLEEEEEEKHFFIFVFVWININQNHKIIFIPDILRDRIQFNSIQFKKKKQKYLYTMYNLQCVCNVIQQ